MNILIILLFVAALFVYLSTGTSRKKQSTIKKEGNVLNLQTTRYLCLAPENGVLGTRIVKVLHVVLVSPKQDNGLWVKNPDSRHGMPSSETETCPIIPCPSDCVYNPGTVPGNPEGWVNGNCREIPGETCGPDGTGIGQMYQTRSVKSEAVGSGTPCGALTRNDGPACSFDTCPSVPCTGEWGPWDTDCESIACGTSITKQDNGLWDKNPDSEARHAQFRRPKPRPVIPCPSDCVYNPGTVPGNPKVG